MSAARTARPVRRRKAPRRPSRSIELELLAALGEGAVVAGMDEVGRGSLAGPVSVGVALVTAATSRRMPRGLADSKMLTAQAREDLVVPVQGWCAGHAVAHAEPEEIDAYGIVAALRLAGRRALAQLAATGLHPGIVILDGVHDWLSDPAQPELLAPPDVLVPGTTEPLAVPPVRTEVKGDAACAVVSAASVLAKVARDALMTQLDPLHPRYGWAGNKGYGSPEHVAALREHGPCELHRRSWRLPTGGDAGLEDLLGPDDDDFDPDGEAPPRDGRGPDDGLLGTDDDLGAADRGPAAQVDGAGTWALPAPAGAGRA